MTVITNPYNHTIPLLDSSVIWITVSKTFYKLWSNCNCVDFIKKIINIVVKIYKKKFWIEINFLILAWENNCDLVFYFLFRDYYSVFIVFKYSKICNQHLFATKLHQWQFNKYQDFIKNKDKYMNTKNKSTLFYLSFVH